jgi:hypothetical protein
MQGQMQQEGCCNATSTATCCQIPRLCGEHCLDLHDTTTKQEGCRPTGKLHSCFQAPEPAAAPAVWRSNTQST